MPRLLLAAMSGVRVRDPELLAAGLTLPGFVERSRVIASLPSLGLLTLASWTPPGWEVAYRDFDEFGEEDLEFAAGFDLVAISTLTARAFEAYRFADGVRARGRTVVIGGLHATVLPEEAKQHADAVVQGEGEPVWEGLVRDFAAGRLARRYQSGPYSFERARVPRYDLLEPDRYNRITLQTTRGCPHACTFCGASRLLSPYRKKPLGQVERELEAIREIWPEPFVELADDNTFVDKAWSRDLARLLGRHRLRWFTETDLSVADDEELLDLLAASDCAQLLIGLESPSVEDLQGLDAWKPRQVARYREKVARIQDHGISVNGCFVLGLDRHGPADFDRVADFAEEVELAEVQVTILTPFPGTELERRMRREGRLPAEPYWDRCTLFDVCYEPGAMSASGLRTEFRELVGRLYGPEATRRRKARFYECRRRRRGREVPA